MARCCLPWNPGPCTSSRALATEATHQVRAVAESPGPPAPGIRSRVRANRRLARVWPRALRRLQTCHPSATRRTCELTSTEAWSARPRWRHLHCPCGPASPPARSGSAATRRRAETVWRRASVWGRLVDGRRRRAITRYWRPPCSNFARSPSVDNNNRNADTRRKYPGGSPSTCLLAEQRCVPRVVEP